MNQSPASLPVSSPSPSSTSRTRLWFVLGFAIGFGLLSMASCGGLAVALGFGGFSLADFQNSGAVWTPAPAELQPLVIDANALNAGSASSSTSPTSPTSSTTPRFGADQVVRNVTNSRVNVRRTPGHLGKPASDVLLQLQAGDSVLLSGEYEVADNLTWWQVQVRGVTGWVAEATASGVQILGE